MTQNNKADGMKLSTTVGDIISSVIMFAISLIVAVILNNLIIFNIEVEGDFMESTITANDRVVGFKVAYTFSEPERLDIIAFNQHGGIGVGRIIGLPEDTIKIIDGKIYVNASDIPLNESHYLSGGTSSNIKPFFVPKGYYFVMGDNRSYYGESSEPRESDFVSQEDIVGKLSVKIYPEIEYVK